MAQKITKRQVTEALLRQSSLEKSANGLLEMIQILNQQLDKSAQVVYSQLQDKALDAIDGNRLTGLSYQLTIETLERNHIKTLRDLNTHLEMDQPLLGVDTEELYRIQKQVRSIVNMRKTSTKLVVDFEKMASESARLVHFVRTHSKIQDSHANFFAQLEIYQRQGKTLAEFIHPEYFNRLRWLITSTATQNARLEAFFKFQSIQDEESNWQSQARVEFEKFANVSEGEEQRYFEAHVSEIYAQMEKLNLVGTTVPEFDESVIPKSLVDEIRRQPLPLVQFKSILRGWQDFGARYILKNKKVLLGDEMGLGKTVQALAAIASLAQSGMTHFLVVCPNSIIINWLREVDKHTTLSGINLHGKPSVREAQLNRWVKEGGVAICNYESIWRMDRNTIFSTTQFLIADEAHLIKNPGRKRSDFVTELAQHVEYALFMSGTALENHVVDMAHLIAPLQPGLLAKIGVSFDEMKESWKGLGGQRDLDNLHVDHFKQAIAPVYLRRNRQDVLAELPTLTQTEEWSEFSDLQKSRYRDAVQAGGFQAMRRVGWTGDSVADIPKLQRLKEICEEAVENNDKVIIFSFFRSVLNLIYSQLSDISVQPIMGGVSAEDRQLRIDDFINSTTRIVLPAQIDTLGYGLNLQAANVIVFAEPQLKPSTEAQALSRAYRMGQIKKVFVYRLLTVNSIDELLMEMLGTKQQLFDAYAKDSVAGSSLDAVDPDAVKLSASILAMERHRLSVSD